MDFSRCTIASWSVFRRWRASLSAWLISSLGSISGTLAGRVFRKQTTIVVCPGSGKLPCLAGSSGLGAGIYTSGAYSRQGAASWRRPRTHHRPQMQPFKDC